ncbi:hypothetical protein T484DRAFT_1839551 [Baffinella frigidus]|nr:hypothetical protein T484DRAFT_1839551 [Cryptophyta sp. CCMP2293]
MALLKANLAALYGHFEMYPANLAALYGHFEMFPAAPPACTRSEGGSEGGAGEGGNVVPNKPQAVRVTPAEEVRPLFLHLVHLIERCLRDDKKRQITTTVFHGEGQKGRAAAAHSVYDGFAKIGEKILQHTPESFGYGNGEACPDGMQRSWQFHHDAIVKFEERSWQFHHDAIVKFEEVRAIRFSSTPIGLRRFCYFLINFSSVALAPYWAHFCAKELFAGDCQGSHLGQLASASA